MRKKTRHQSILSVALLAIVLAVPACGNFSYYKQAISGHRQIMKAREPVVDVLARAELNEQVRQKLQLSQEALDFAANELQLPVDMHYQHYVDLERDSVVWNVFAAQELSFESEQWCYLVVGCLTYRGYFEQARAQEYAAELELASLDVYVGRVAAYSTLGWFDDPITNVMLQRGPLLLVSLFFHELAHQVVYVSDDTTFNESFAVAVEHEGMRRWFLAHPDVDASKYYRYQAAHQLFVSLVLSYRSKLQAAYDDNVNDDIKRDNKYELLAEMKIDYLSLCGEDCYFSNWFDDVNNAKLNTIATYEELVPQFTALMQQSDDISIFYQEVKVLADMTKIDRLQVLLDKAAEQ